MPSKTPTKRFTVINTADAVAEITAYLKSLAAEGERPWCEVFYPAPDWLPDDAARAAWNSAQEKTFDAVELVDGEIVTLPAYTELEAQA